MKVTLCNSLTKVVYVIDNLDDLNTSGKYYTFDITLPDGMVDGEYEYEVVDDNNIVATGICQIGEYNTPQTSYTGQTKKEYIVYEG